MVRQHFRSKEMVLNESSHDVTSHSTLMVTKDISHRGGSRNSLGGGGGGQSPRKGRPIRIFKLTSK